MAAANRIEGLPPEMLRADRFDKILFVGFPSEEERLDIFRIHLGEATVNHNIENLAAATPQFTGAEIKSLIADVRFKISSSERRHITTEDIVAAVPKFRNRLWLKHRSGIIDMYRRALSEWEWASTGQLNDAELIIGGGTSIGKKNAVVTKF
jgi:ATP-dependent 26S proteasome regulatory subunit